MIPRAMSCAVTTVPRAIANEFTMLFAATARATCSAQAVGRGDPQPEVVARLFELLRSETVKPRRFHRPVAGIRDELEDAGKIPFRFLAERVELNTEIADHFDRPFLYFLENVIY